jgi:Na+/phosphate symporter
MSDLIEDLIYISNESHKHINNNHSPLRAQQINDLNQIFEFLSSVFKEGIEAFNVQFSDKEFNDVLMQKKQSFDLLNQKIDDQILRIEGESSPKNTALYFNILIRTKDLILHKFDLVEEFYRVSKKIKS